MLIMFVFLLIQSIVKKTFNRKKSVVGALMVVGYEII